MRQNISINPPKVASGPPPPSSLVELWTCRNKRLTTVHCLRYRTEELHTSSGVLAGRGRGRGRRAAFLAPGNRARLETSMSPASKHAAKKATNGNTTGTNSSSYVNGTHQHLMDRGAAEYSQSGLSAPYQAFVEHPSESAPPDPASAAQYSTPAQEARTAPFPSSSTPNPEYGLPSSARSGTFPEYITRQPFPQDGTPRFPSANNQTGSSGGMAPSQASLDRPHHASQEINSDLDLSLDPNIAAQTSPTYPPGGPQYSPYPPGHDMSAYQGHPAAGGIYARPDWQYPGGHHGMPGAAYGAHPSPTTTVSSASSAAPVGRGPGGQASVSTPGPALLLISLAGLLLCANSGRPAVEASSASIRRNRAHVQMWLEWLRKGIWDAESFECTCYDAISWHQEDSRGYVLLDIFFS